MQVGRVGRGVAAAAGGQGMGGSGGEEVEKFGPRLNEVPVPVWCLEGHVADFCVGPLQIEQIVQQLRPDLQTSLFSATWTDAVQRMAATYVRDAVQVCVCLCMCASLSLSLSLSLSVCAPTAAQGARVLTVVWGWNQGGAPLG